LFERGDRVVEHAPVRRGSRGCEVGSRAGKGKLDGAASGGGIAFLRRQLAAERLPAFRLSLLKLDVLALEPSRHITAEC